MLDETYKHILMCYDGSKNAEKALMKAVNVAKRNEAKLSVVHIIHKDNPQFEVVKPSNFQAEADQHAEEIRRHVEAVMDRADFKAFEVLIDTGNPKTKITYDYIDDLGTDLVICGHTGMDSYDKMDMGSTSENIARYSSVDVMIVK
ncbi:universal stress protein [Salisediminibacterium selenitireducens]|uniref:Universal stress protein n=1 Tax=Bacillus selenitireducens (strain ATCC 700615 / DSM 15326 / MLS10) TaxID=439292 RepID=D6XSE3_BACIE|nr:universal stress protein [Salisediminibacterium selenitireducens]ADH98729.1 UspA domain protein [[Bacillus] selenitireducens MLS10]